MQDRYRLYQRENGVFYLKDKITGKQQSTRTKDDSAAARHLRIRTPRATPTPPFSDLTPGEHEVKAGFPDLAATQGSVKITVAARSFQFVPAPVKAMASNESPDGKVAHLFDGNLSPDSLGKSVSAIGNSGPRIVKE